MAFQMIHMEVAYRILILDLTATIKNKDAFLLGALAPDAVHMDEAFSIEQKITSHLFEGCGPWGDTQDYEQWIQNITSFDRQIESNSANDLERDFQKGMVVHCLTDYWNDRILWRGAQKEHVPPMTLDIFREAFYPEARGIDQWLYQNSVHRDAIFKLLKQTMPIDFGVYVKKENAEKMKEHLLYHQYTEGNTDITNYCYIKEAVIEDFLTETVDKIGTFLNI